MAFLEKRIKEVHPNTEVVICDYFNGLGSLEPMWSQVNKIGQDLMAFSSKHPEGIHLIGYSQGGLIARGILENFSNHNVKTFISLSSPQAGQYGTKFLHLWFPELITETAYKVFYTVTGQFFSVGNYWNDPHKQELYRNYSVFLPYINNEIASRRDPSYYNGLVKLENMVLIGGPDDEVITPWQSSIFGYYNSNEEIEYLRDRAIYKEDFIGLKTLDREKKLKIIIQRGVKHLAWRKNITIIDNDIIPHLN
ncbi:hypothetical protein RUM44_003455 [Polyplax serrata]|uniref:palmitoyl-CoA hydrolase n=1 Tax=Polyplax serrata TaxID=468196 RepID=A0ABR1AGH3_POLSC